MKREGEGHRDTESERREERREGGLGIWYERGKERRKGKVRVYWFGFFISLVPRCERQTTGGEEKRKDGVKKNEKRWREGKEWR